jgi:drug/metabolite transporter (DMT)-like permease
MRLPLARRAALWLVVAAGCWGLDTTLSAYALRQLRPADLFIAETSVGAAVVWAYVWGSRRYRRPGRLRPHMVLGLIEPGFAYLLFNLGLSRTSAVSAGLLLSTETLLGVALAVVFLRERLMLAAGVALALGTAGSVLVSLQAGHGHETITGDLLVLAGSATAAVYFLVARKLPSEDDTLTGTAYQLLAASGVALAFGVANWSTRGSTLPVASVGHLGVGIAAGVVGIAIPFFLLNRSLERVQASTAALILNLVPVFAVASAATLLMEPLMAGTVAGGALILIGLVVLSRAPEPVAVTGA